LKVKNFRFLFTSVRAVIIGSVFVIGVIVGIVTLGDVMADSVSNDSSRAPNFAVNKNGQSYGSALNATSPDTEPDLIKAYGVDGTLGYVKSEDLNVKMPKSPEEALSKQRSRALSGDRQIPLYDVDGKTVIGKFNVSQGDGEELSPSAEK